MASRKQLKKSIKNITGSLFADCVALSMCQQGNQEALDELMTEVIALHMEFIDRINHYDSENAQAYFRKLKNDITHKVNDLNERIIKA